MLLGNSATDEKTMATAMYSVPTVPRKGIHRAWKPSVLEPVPPASGRMTECVLRVRRAARLTARGRGPCRRR